MTTQIEIQGQIKRILYHNEDSNFFVFTFEDVQGVMRKAKGNFSLDAPYPGMPVSLKGQWENSKYGETFGVTGITNRGLSSNDGIEKYLMNYIPEIGPVSAKRIVDHFGQDTLDVLDNAPERLEEVPRLNKVQKQKIAEEWKKQGEYRDIAISLLNLDLTDAVVKRVYSKWGAEALAKIQENPYCLTTIRGVGFLTADKVALGMGVPSDSPFRIGACLEYTLREASGGPGHLFLDPKTLIEGLTKLVRKGTLTEFGRQLSTSDIKEGLRHLKEQKIIVSDKGKIYLTPYHTFEQQSARLLAGFLRRKGSPICSEEDTQAFIQEYEDVNGLTLSQEQREGIEAVREHRVLLITGLPGTGKSSLMKAIVQLLRNHKKEVQLLSPTGIAAKRLSSVVGLPASTIHRALGYKGDLWIHNSKNKYIKDAIIIDEASMIDQQVMYHLLDALHEDTLLVFVGDHAQLPSVGAGNVLHDLIRSECIKQIHLTQIFRQEEASDIILNSHRINMGQDPVLHDRDFHFIPHTSEDSIVDNILELVNEIQGLGTDDTFQVLSPKWKGTLGVTNLNNRIREVLNPLENQREVTLKNGLVLRQGDRVMVMSNDYEKEVYNGETGTILEINSKESEIVVRIRDAVETKTVPISYSEAPDLLNLAFCMTTHKSQGQEMDYIIFPFVNAFSIQLQKNLLYTAVTRAKKKVYILGDWSAIQKAVRNNEVAERNTFFAERLREEMGHA